ncbi:MAG: hypothetical protein JRG73_09185 [Deltaproteobacteria bacterium]|nr:hypothetical protein [Deltaproteobacteria bacterium]MBW2307095.1 hypothetical protein [Deltaproteobacteria bacterium]
MRSGNIKALRAVIGIALGTPGGGRLRDSAYMARAWPNSGPECWRRQSFAEQ